ncbi:MAG: hypothetical protein ACLTIG_01115 [Roseburia hominis]
MGFVNPLIMYSISTAWMIQAIMLIMGKFKSTRGCRKESEHYGFFFYFSENYFENAEEKEFD